jgi:hypothetical protein
MFLTLVLTRTIKNAVLKACGIKSKLKGGTRKVRFENLHKIAETTDQTPRLFSR